jgi:hypothetical protein
MRRSGEGFHERTRNDSSAHALNCRRKNPIHGVVAAVLPEWMRRRADSFGNGPHGTERRGPNHFFHFNAIAEECFHAVVVQFEKTVPQGLKPTFVCQRLRHD